MQRRLKIQVIQKPTGPVESELGYVVRNIDIIGENLHTHTLSHTYLITFDCIDTANLDKFIK